MKAKERLYAVVGGCVGAVITMAVCSFLPHGAQSQSGQFGEIICSELTVVDSKGKQCVQLKGDLSGRGVVIYNNKEEIVAVVGGNAHGGTIAVYDNKGQNAAGMSSIEHGGGIIVNGSQGQVVAGMISSMHGGKVAVYGKGNAPGMALERHIGIAQMHITTHGGSVEVYGHEKTAGTQIQASALMHITEDGGRVAVDSNGDSEGKAAMEVNRYGNGVVGTWDKNGYRQ